MSDGGTPGAASRLAGCDGALRGTACREQGEEGGGEGEEGGGEGEGAEEGMEKRKEPFLYTHPLKHQ